MRDRGKWTETALAYLQTVKEVLSELHGYWPLTLRQIYYQLVAAGHIQNAIGEYKKLSRQLTKARLDGHVDWRAMEDRSRSALGSQGWDDADDFKGQQLNEFLEGYRRDLLQGQDCKLELWVEKDALSRVCHRVAFPLCVDVIVAKGFSSVSFLHQCAQRVRASHVPTKLLYFGDLDPSGWEMLPSMLETLQDEMGLGDRVQGIRCALTPEQVQEHGLPINPDALKETDSRAAKYMAQFGDLAVELDALPPKVLSAMVRDSILGEIDTDLLDEEQATEAVERDQIAELKVSVQEVMEDQD